MLKPKSCSINKYATLVTSVAGAFKKQDRNTNALQNTLPLDPVVSLLLGPISKRRFSQMNVAYLVF